MAKQQQATALTVQPPRLPYHPLVKERFNMDRTDWKAVVEAIFPLAKTADSVILALAYCKARKLDVMKRVVHIVPIWDKNRGCMVETVWPGIAELRTTAHRTKSYAGKDETEWAEEIEVKVGNVVMHVPEYAQITVYRLVGGERQSFPGPQVYWIEAYAQKKRDDKSPNSMWERRPKGMLEKCAEAAALRVAFPEELGGEIAVEEVEGGYDFHGRDAIDVPGQPADSSQLDALTQQLTEPAKEEPPYDPPTGEEQAGAEQKPPKKKARPKPPADTQVNPEVDATDGVDAEPGDEPTSDSEEVSLIERIRAATTISELDALAGEIEAHGILTEASKDRLTKLIVGRRVEIRGKRGSKSNG